MAESNLFGLIAVSDSDSDSSSYADHNPSCDESKDDAKKDITDNEPSNTLTKNNLNTQNTNYFGLYDTGSDSDDEVKNQHSDSNKQSSAGAATSHVKRGISRSQNSSYNGSVRGDEHNKQDKPDGAFWNDKHEIVNWRNAEKIWKTEHTNDFTAWPTQAETHTNDQQPVSKRTRLDSDSKSTHHGQSHDAKSPANTKLEKSCFYVHHKVAPMLGADRMSNRIPRTCLLELTGHSGAVNRIRWCCSNYSHLFLSASMDQTVKIWNGFSSNKTSVQTLKHHKRAVKDAKWSPDGHNVLSCGYDKASCLSDVELGKCIQRFEEDSFVTCVTYHPVNHHVFVSGSSNQLRAWDSRSPTNPVRLFKYKDKFGQVQDVEFVTDGSQFFTCNDAVSRDSADRNIMAWDFRKGVVISNQIYQERYTCSRLRIHPCENHLLAQTQGGYVAQFSSVSPYKINKCKRFEGHRVEGYAVGVDVSPDGQIVVSGSSQGFVPFYDYRTTRIKGRIALENAEVCLDVMWHPILPSTVALANWSGKISVWC